MTLERRSVFRHEKKDHDLGYKQTGTDYRRLYVEPDNDSITVGKSDEFDTAQSGVFCFTCDRWLSDDSVIDDWY